MATAFFVKNDWNEDTLDCHAESWVNDGRDQFETEAEAQAILDHRITLAPEEAGRLRVSSYEYELEDE